MNTIKNLCYIQRVTNVEHIRIVKEFTQADEVVDYIKSHPVDLLITDMRMPRVDGIELIKQVKEYLLQIEIIAISSYKDFHYVKESLKEGSIDYVLKHTMNEEVLTQALMEASKLVFAKGRERMRDEEIYDESQEALKEKIFNQLFHNEITPQKVEETLKRHNITLDMNSFVLILCEVDDYARMEIRFQGDDKRIFLDMIRGVIEKVVDKVPEKVIVSVRDGCFAVLLFFSGIKSQLYIYSKCDEYCKRFNENVRKILGVQLSLYGLYKELKKRGDFGVRSTPNGYRKKYSYALSNDFIYDHRDYESIPGLKFDDEHSEVGFLTPVYFDRKALLYFIANPDYVVDIFSETYGHIGKKDHEGIYEHEWAVSFGFNTNGKLVFWLGDLESMDDMSRGIFRNFNISSDHLLIDSEFYQAQMNCIFSESIKEKQIILNKQNFITNIKVKNGIDLSHLESECKSQERNIKRPIVFNEQSVSGVINAFDKILIEGINVSQLRALYKILYEETSREKGYNKWQSIRLLKEILRKLSADLSDSIDIEYIMSPLFVLHDYRIYLDHLLSEGEQEKYRQHIACTLGAYDFSEQEKIYFEEVRRLDILFQYLVLLSK